MHFALIYNPCSGRRHSHRKATIQAITEVLRLAGEVSTFATACAGDATNQARIAIDQGCDNIIAAGGDGTVHEILQTIVDTKATAALGIVPLGTGNVLASDIGLPHDPISAARCMLECRPRRIAAGCITSTDPTRGHYISKYFCVAAGVGAHSRLISEASAKAKCMAGLTAYYYAGLRSLTTHNFLPMRLRITAPNGTISSREVVEVVAMRVSSFGGMLKNWRPGGTLISDELRLVLLTRADRLALIRYSIDAFLGHTREALGVEFLSAISVDCTEVDSTATPTRAQADGEVLGITPISLSILPNAFNLLMPAG